MKLSKRIYKIFCPITDFLRTRKKVWKFFILPGIMAVLSGLLLLFQNRNADETVQLALQKFYGDFVSVSITGTSILISFSLAVITILCSSDSQSIEKIKKDNGSADLYSPLSKEKKPPKLFQILLSGITYNVLTEILFLIFLFVQLFLLVFSDSIIMSFCLVFDVFTIVHILCVLWSIILALYFTYWKT